MLTVTARVLFKYKCIIYIWILFLYIKHYCLKLFFKRLLFGPSVILCWMHFQVPEAFVLLVLFCTIIRATLFTLVVFFFRLVICLLCSFSTSCLCNWLTAASRFSALTWGGKKLESHSFLHIVLSYKKKRKKRSRLDCAALVTPHVASLVCVCLLGAQVSILPAQTPKAE